MVIASGSLPGGRVVIVTGGSRGVGREAIRRLAGLGYAVVVNYAHDQRAADSTVEAILAENGTAMAVRADVDDDLDVERLFTETIEAFGAIDAVVHAVRGRVTATPVAEISLDDFDALLRTNIRATFVVNRMAARQVRNGGAIVNLSSPAVTSPRPASGAYAVTTAAADVLTRVLAVELRDRDITVNGVSLEAGRRRPAIRVADLVAYLLSDAGHGITGQVIHLNDQPWRPA
jgi:3-oxoacyl-[acyl-carrier protein] reductase